MVCFHTFDEKRDVSHVFLHQSYILDELFFYHMFLSHLPFINKKKNFFNFITKNTIRLIMFTITNPFTNTITISTTNTISLGLTTILTIMFTITINITITTTI